MGCCSSKSSEKSVLTEHDTVSLSLVEVQVVHDVGSTLASDTPSGKLMDSFGVPLTRSDDVVEEASPMEHEIIFVDTPDAQPSSARIALQKDVNSAEVSALLATSEPQEDTVQEDEVTTVTTVTLEAKDSNEPSHLFKSGAMKDVVEANGGLRMPEPTFDTVAQSGTFVDNEAAARSPRSPGRRCTNPEDMPIESMYHRVHLAEMEEQDAARKEELRLEAERHEQEVREFRASMLSTKD